MAKNKTEKIGVKSISFVHDPKAAQLWFEFWINRAIDEIKNIDAYTQGDNHGGVSSESDLYRNG